MSCIPPVELELVHMLAPLIPVACVAAAGCWRGGGLWCSAAGRAAARDHDVRMIMTFVRKIMTFWCLSFHDKPLMILHVHAAVVMRCRRMRGIAGRCRICVGVPTSIWVALGGGFNDVRTCWHQSHAVHTVCVRMPGRLACLPMPCMMPCHSTSAIM